ncbi:MAG: TetR/AcrR family transcriptional regulator [Sphingomonadaceae bacterium]
MPGSQTPQFTVPDLHIRSREGGYARGREGHETILRAALNLLVEQGYRAMSMRKVAAACGMKLGNLTYYFPTKEDLVRELLDAVITSYEIEFEAIIHEEGVSPEQRLEEICTLILEDIRTKKTTRVFPELWALSNHDPFVFDRVHELYARARAPLLGFIHEINPDLTPEQTETLALFISASMEGLTVFAGHDKPFEKRMPWLEKIAAKSFVQLVKSVTPDDLG